MLVCRGLPGPHMVMAYKLGGYGFTRVMAELERTSWRGMQVDHPAEWELAIACGVDEPPRCVFADRCYHRLDIRWRALAFEPHMDLVLQKHRRRTEKQSDTPVKDLTGAPPQWQGVVRNISEGTIVNAVRFVPDARWLVDVVLAWPKTRDVNLENRILASISVEDPGAKARLWQAMGISLSLGRQFDLVRCQARVGQVKWHFATDQKRSPKLLVERIALPEYWLKGALRDWLLQQVPSKHKVSRQDAVKTSGHSGEKILSRGKLGALASIRGLAEIILGVAWLCPVEQRVYHVRVSDITRQPEISLPGDLNVRCCRPAPVAKH